MLWMVQNGFLDDVALERIKEFQGRLTEFLTLRKDELLRRIAREKTLNEELVAELKAAADSFKETWK